MQTFSFTRLEIAMLNNDKQTTFTFSGEITEQFRQSNIPEPTTLEINFDLEKLNYFNSAGIREWTNFIERLSHKAKLYFHHCSVAMMDQLNLISSCLGKASLKSFFAPYYCDCGHQSDQLVDMHKNAPFLQKNQVPDFSCPVCQKNMHFDALEDHYLAVVRKNLKQVS